MAGFICHKIGFRCLEYHSKYPLQNLWKLGNKKGCKQTAIGDKFLRGIEIWSHKWEISRGGITYHEFNCRKIWRKLTDWHFQSVIRK